MCDLHTWVWFVGVAGSEFLLFCLAGCAGKSCVGRSEDNEGHLSREAEAVGLVVCEVL